MYTLPQAGHTEYDEQRSTNPWIDSVSSHRFQSGRNTPTKGSTPMSLETLGAPLVEDDGRKRPKSRIATIFLDKRTLVTLPGIHATQRIQFLEFVDADRKERGLPPLSRKERDTLCLDCVDLILQDNLILIRPNPQRIDLMFQADELLQQIASKRRIRFLGIQNEAVYQAIKRRGECWRITPAPRSTHEIKRMIANSLIGIGGREIYRYNNTTGTRWLTCEQFSKLGMLEDEILRSHLLEIQQYAASVNSRRYWEVDFFADSGKFRSDILARDFQELDANALRETHRKLAEEFFSVIPEDLRRDDPTNVTWRKQMFDALTPEEEHLLWEENRLGLSPEFHMHVQWLPGGRIVDGALLFDSVFSEQADDSDRPVRDDTIRSLVFNYVRDRGNLEYINVGRVVERLSKRQLAPGRRDVYVVEMKEQDRDTETVKIIRMQKWDVRERLDEGTPLLNALIDSEVYTEYIRDRGLGCRQLGMNIAGRVATGKICEVYSGKQVNLCGLRFWTPYFERNYIRGIATDKLLPTQFQNGENSQYAAKFASLLGRAAAANMIVGRCTPGGDVLFDDGDEVLIMDEQGMPSDLVVVDYTGAFAAFEQELHHFAAAYARPINSRIIHVKNRTDFVENYLTALLARFQEIRQIYREHRAAYDLLFGHRPETERGSIGHRWKCVLQRLDATDLDQLEAQLRRHLPTGDAVTV